MNRLAWLLMVLVSLPALAGRGLTVPEESRPAPAFELPAVDGAQRRLSDYRGRYVLVNFWAVWCSPCRKEMPSMQATFEQLEQDGLAMVAIHVGPSVDGARRFAEELGLSFDILVDEQMALASWRVMGLPTSYLLDPEGRIIAEAVGERDWADPALVERLRALMK